jgi:predicted enzyme related to lactoylglutathione lyase
VALATDQNREAAIGDGKVPVLRRNLMANSFAHIELTTSDLGAAKKFYKKLFDWKLTDTPMGDGGGVYTMIAPGKGPGGGMQAQPMPQAPVTWLPYVEVDDVKKTIAKAEKAGAKVVVPRMDIGKNGIIGIFVDPAGAMLGVWSKAKPTKKGKKKA